MAGTWLPWSGTIRQEVSVMFWLRIRAVLIAGTVVIAAIVPATAGKKLLKKDPQPSALDVYIQQASQRTESSATASGSLWSPGALFNDLGADLRARHVDDVVTIV